LGARFSRCDVSSADLTTIDRSQPKLTPTYVLSMAELFCNIRRRGVGHQAHRVSFDAAVSASGKKESNTAGHVGSDLARSDLSNSPNSARMTSA
jgi:hypothetical protein